MNGRTASAPVRAEGVLAGTTDAGGPGPVPAHRLVGSRQPRRDSITRRLLAISDISAIVIAEMIGMALATIPAGPAHFVWSLILVPCWLLVFRAYGLYDRDSRRVSHRTIDDVPWVLHGIFVGGALLWGLFKVAPVSVLAVRQVVLIAVLATMLVLAFRQLTRWLLQRHLGPERVLVMGDARLTALLARKMRDHPEYGLNPVGVISASDESATISVLPVLGDPQSFDLAELVTRHQIDRVLVSHLEIDEAVLMGILHQCRRLAIKMSVVPRLFDALGPSVAVDDVEGITVLGINPPVLSRSSRLIKRTTDIIGALCALVLTAPLLAMIAVAIVVDSRGPVLFRQLRIGRGGRRFWVVKFRTMVPNAEQMTSELLAQSADPNWLLLENDPRITRVGRTLRMASLDELPQLWNVLKGEMSLVGPRPLIEREENQLEDWARARIDLTPGLTGLWQVLGRTNIPFAEMAKLDYVYVTNWTLWGDVRLLVKTLPVVLSRRGAN